MLLFPALLMLGMQANSPAPALASLDSKDLAVVVCKTKAKTNTRFGTRTCRTRAEWNEIAEQQRRDALEMVGSMRQNPCSGGDTYSCGGRDMSSVPGKN